ncbi:hypothetical protein [Actinomadura madurae]|uniref:hypothetical protein n=1 Tax=Actinomadura madurae TaxID=1993 RepID=UPI0020D24D13|nr:hypothetical protein [Actinomadura madurae]MCQ0016661.1 hypothetical protein [Actinomadura madurae]
MAPHRHGWKTIRAENIVGCTAGLLRFATPAEMDVLIGMLPPSTSGRPRAVTAWRTGSCWRRCCGAAGPATWICSSSTRCGPATRRPCSARLLDLDDPEVNATLLDAVTALGGVPRNLRRQLAHQTSRRDGATPRPLPAATRQDLLSGLGGSGALDHAMLYSADPDMAGTALWFLGAGADPHGAVQACRTLLDAHRGHEIRQLVEQGRLPAFQWGPDGSLPSVLAYAQAALESGQGSGGCATSPTRPARPSSCGRSPRSPTRPGASRGAAAARPHGGAPPPSRRPARRLGRRPGGRAAPAGEGGTDPSPRRPVHGETYRYSARTAADGGRRSPGPRRAHLRPVAGTARRPVRPGGASGLGRAGEGRRERPGRRDADRRVRGGDRPR